MEGSKILSVNAKSGKRWMKAELHAHCCLDPIDYRICKHTPEELISTAASLGYEILAITCHNLDVWTEALADYAGELHICRDSGKNGCHPSESVPTGQSAGYFSLSQGESWRGNERVQRHSKATGPRQ